MKNTPVLIVGAGPVGLSMALGLALQDIECIVVERHPSTTNHPKARGINTRTMEIFRLYGVEEAMRIHQLPPESHRFIWLESLQGPEITRVSARPRKQCISPTSAAIISQDWVEYELLQAVKKHKNIQLLFNTKAEHIEQHNDGVIVSLKDMMTQNDSKVHAHYVVAADGASSPIRDMFSVDMHGEANLGEFCNIFCEMDLSRYTAHRPAAGYIFTRNDVRGTFMLSKDGLKEWLVGIRYDVVGDVSLETFTDAYCKEYIERLIDDPSIKVTLINKAFWTMAALIAKTWRVKRVLFAGDSAHRLPPTGGLGMNSGVQDAHNIAWKLAAVVRKEAKESLLDTYYTERAPVVAANIAWSMKNAQRFNKIFAALELKDFKTMAQALEEQNDHLNQLALDLGFCYCEGALIEEKQSAVSYSESDDYIPSTIPGCRAPHYPLVKAGKLISTLDLFNKNFVLLSHATTTIWHEAVASLPKLPLISYRVGNNADLDDAEENWCNTYQVTPNGAVLIRPDGHVAWRAVHGSQTAHNDLKSVFKTLGF